MSNRKNTMIRERLWAILGINVILAACVSSSGTPVSTLSRDDLAQIRFDQQLGGQVSGELELRDEAGRWVQLSDCLDRKPAILVLGYYQCPMLCNLVFNGLVISLHDIKLDAGNQFQVVVVSIDPTESPELAAAKKRNYLIRYGRSNAERGWHFLTGPEPAIAQLAQETGFHYAYDPSLHQYAHPSGLVILTPQGRISKYFFGISYPPKELAAALIQAGASRIGSPIEQLLLLCFHYNPLSGKYGPVIQAVLRLGAFATLLSLAALAFWRRPYRYNSAVSGANQPLKALPDSVAANKEGTDTAARNQEGDLP
jgi:protein SCO1